MLFGNYGSGKTELSLNIALRLAQNHSDVTLIDLDIVNPYFRSSEHKAMLSKNGIRVIAPVYANTAVDLPALPPDVYTAFNSGYAVFDCGGDPVGAAALGSLKPRFDEVRDACEVLFIINARRPFQDSTQALYESLSRIQKSARIHADGLILNTNLGADSTGEELVQSYALVQSFERIAGIPLKYVSGAKQALDVFDAHCIHCTAQRIVIKPYTRPEWL